MKKLLLFVYLLGIVAYLGHAQSLTLSDAGVPVPNNSYVNVTGLPGDDEIVVELSITNTTPAALPVMCKKVELDMVPGTASLFCWGLCFSPSVFVSPDPITIEGNTTNDVDFSGHYLPSGVSGMSTIRYVFYDQHNPNDSVCANVNFHAYPLGTGTLSGKETVSAYPNPTAGKVTFTGQADGTSTVVIRNILGTQVGTVTLSASGTAVFDAGTLPAGIYFYTLVTDGKTAATKKLIVRD